MTTEIRALASKHDALTAKAANLFTKAAWLDVNGRSGMRTYLIALDVKAEAAKTMIEIERLTAGMTFIDRLFAMYSDADLAARGWEIEAMQKEAA